MKKVQHFLVSLLLMAMVVTQGLFTSVIAQEPTVKVDISVLLQLQGKEPSDQKDYLVYEILRSDTKEVVWEYRADNPPVDSLRLTTGDYIFRLYDGQGFVREGSSIIATKVEQSIPQRTPQETTDDKKMKTLTEKGQIRTLADGNRVYELPFEVVLGPDLVDPNTGEMISKLVVHLADEASEVTTNPPASTTPTTGILVFHVVDENGTAISGVAIEVEQQIYTTDESGNIRIADVVGDIPYQVTALPEGYEGTLSDVATVTAGNEHTIELLINKVQAVERGSLTFNVIDQAGNSVEGVTITVNNQAYTTDTQGQVTVNDLEVGQYSYAITQLPENHEGNKEGIAEVIANQNVVVELQTTQKNPMESEAQLTFRIKNQDGQPVSGVVLSVTEQELTTDEAGEAQLSLPIGHKYIYSAVRVPEGYDLEGMSPTEVSLDKDTLIELTLPAKAKETGDIAFVVTDDKETPLPNITVKLGEQQLTTNANGVAAFNQISVGEYAFELTTTGEYKVPELERTISIEAGQEMTFPIQLIAPAQHGNVVFKVQDQDGKAVEGAGIFVAEREILTDAQGNAQLNDLAVGDYAYKLSKLPDKYKGEISGVVQVTASETKEIVLKVERSIQLSTARITVLDDKGNPASQVRVAFGGLNGLTNEEGVVEFTSLQPGKYYYSITEVPSQYQSSAEQKEADITEGATFTDQLTLTLKPAVGYAEFKVVDQKQQPVAGVAIKLGDKVLYTNNQGIASFEVTPGNHTYQVIEVPTTFQLDSAQQQVQVSAQQTSSHTIQLKAKTTDSTQQTPQGTQVFFDDATGISIKVSASDAKNIVKFMARQVSRPAQEPAALKGKEAQLYELALVDRNNQPVALTSVAEVVFPAPTDASDVQIVKIDANGTTANIAYELIKGKIVMSTQALGTFAITYNKPATSSSSSQSSSSVTVTKAKRIEAKQNLPKTGEGMMGWIIPVAVILLIGGAVLFYRNRLDK